ncbi:alpha/beta hydrolase fold domain-containing protein [Demequina sp. NBRC 110051]|uniref:alpha/beta hydrolase fold domain-containing protein n=1 Tax=Demequina sp. NBRC 110051 TaxID=1570340 RepID=UPI000A076DAF|nr:alpha/beta hydrolase fold domain-containing protein [Demequina sp. NBRC 110051]
MTAATLTVEDVRIDGAVPARLYRPADAVVGSRGIVWCHGGGFVHGDLDMPEADAVARRFAGAGHVVLSVDYRLVTAAGEQRFPAAHEDVLAAVAWMAASAAGLGVDAGALVLGGASAGGNIAAGVALRLAREAAQTGATKPTDLYLAYPVTHASLPSASPEAASAVVKAPEGRRFRPSKVAAMNLHYVGDAALLADPYAFPGGHDLTGMPRTLIIDGDADDLRAMGETFAAELAAAGADVTYAVEPGTTHGHLNHPELPHAERTLTTVLAWLAGETR